MNWSAKKTKSQKLKAWTCFILLLGIISAGFIWRSELFTILQVCQFKRAVLSFDKEEYMHLFNQLVYYDEKTGAFRPINAIAENGMRVAFREAMFHQIETDFSSLGADQIDPYLIVSILMFSASREYGGIGVADDDDGFSLASRLIEVATERTIVPANHRWEIRRHGNGSVQFYDWHIKY